MLVYQRVYEANICYLKYMNLFFFNTGIYKCLHILYWKQLETLNYDANIICNNILETLISVYTSG
jgi:hypothetical protein